MSNKIDKIIDDAPTENHALFEITKIARKSHGDEVVDRLIDESGDEESLKASIVKLARNPKQNFFDKNFWGTLDTLTPLGKAFSHVMTPITESVRGPFQYAAQQMGTSQTPPIDPLAEFEDGLGRPSSRAGFGPLLTDISNAMGVQQRPLANVDIENMPTTSAVLTQLSNPAEAGGAILEGAMGTKNFKIPGVDNLGIINRARSVTSDLINPASTGAEFIDKARIGVGKPPMMPRNRAMAANFDTNLQNLAGEFYPSTILDPLTSRTNKRNMISNYVTEAAKDRGLLDEILENGQFEYMVDMLEQNPDLIKPFNKKGSLDLMEGPVVSGLNPETNRMGYKRDPSQGQLGKLAAQQGMIIDEIPDLFDVNKEDFLSSALNELPGGLDSTQRTSAERLISDSVKPVTRDPEKLRRVQQSMDLRDQIIESGGKYGVEPDMVSNPEYRPELQWLSDLPVETDLSNVYPRNTQRNVTTISKEGDALIPGYTTDIISETDLGREFNPTPRNQSILDIAMGKQNIPREIPNPNKLVMRDQVRQLFDDLMGVEDPTIPDVDTYNEFMYQQNQTPAVPFLNEQRKTGNVYIDQTSPFMDPRDVASRHHAGQALESAASQGLKQPMSELPGLTKELYQDTNRGISTRRNYRDLLSGSRAEKDSFGRVVPQGDVERGVVSRVLGSADEFVVPTGHKVADYLQRQGVQYGGPMTKASTVSLQSYRIPRDSAQIMEQKEIVSAKIGKELGPEFSADMKKINDPDAMKIFLRQVEQFRPDLFEKDPYARMDGIIENPILKQKALEDTLKNNTTSVLDRANAVEDLLINNRFLG